MGVGSGVGSGVGVVVVPKPNISKYCGKVYLACKVGLELYVAIKLSRVAISNKFSLFVVTCLLFHHQGVLQIRPV